MHPEGPVYTFWDYRRMRWERDGGMRLDHFLLSPELAGRLSDAGVDREVRGRENASDHAPVWIELAACAPAGGLTGAYALCMACACPAHAPICGTHWHRRSGRLGPAGPRTSLTTPCLFARTGGAVRVRVLTVVAGMGVGGTERAAQNLSLGLKALGAEVAVLAHAERGPREGAYRDAGIEVFGPGEGVAAAVGWKPDIVHIHRPGYANARRRRCCGR